MTKSITVCQEIKPWTQSYAFCFISCLFTKGAFQPMSLLQPGKKEPMFSNVTKYKRYIKWICVKKLRTKSCLLGSFSPLRESDIIALSARYFLSLHTQSSGLKSLHVSSGTDHDTRETAGKLRRLGRLKGSSASWRWLLDDEECFWPSCHNMSHMFDHCCGFYRNFTWAVDMGLIRT